MWDLKFYCFRNQPLENHHTFSNAEQGSLAHLETTIERGLQTFYEVGKALTLIRDLSLYRVEYSTFEDYCRDRWGMQRAYAGKLVAACKVVDNLYPIGYILPATASQARPLAKLEPEQQQEVWAEVVKTALNGKVTDAHVESVVRDY